MEVNWYYSLCVDCKEKHDQEREAARFEKAEKILEVDYDGPVFHENYPENDGYAASLDEMMEWFFAEGLLDDGQLPLPHYVWACKVRTLKLDAQSILEGVISDRFYEEAYDDLTGIDELQTALDAWCGVQTIESWESDPGRAVLVDFEERANVWRLEHLADTGDKGTFC
jgi:hypothetical protein